MGVLDVREWTIVVSNIEIAIVSAVVIFTRKVWLYKKMLAQKWIYLIQVVNKNEIW